MKKLKTLLIILIAVPTLFVAITFPIYYFNGDMKLVRVIYEKLQPHYDNLEKDRKL